MSILSPIWLYVVDFLQCWKVIIPEGVLNLYIIVFVKGPNLKARRINFIVNARSCFRIPYTYLWWFFIDDVINYSSFKITCTIILRICSISKFIFIWRVQVQSRISHYDFVCIQIFFPLFLVCIYLTCLNDTFDIIYKFL